MSFRKKNSHAAADYAAKKAAAMARARELREQRTHGSVTEDCTFEPKFVSKRLSPKAAKPSFNPTYDDADTLDAYASAAPVPNPRKPGAYRELVTFGAGGDDPAREAHRRAAAHDLGYDDGEWFWRSRVVRRPPPSPFPSH